MVESESFYLQRGNEDRKKSREKRIRCSAEKKIEKEKDYDLEFSMEPIRYRMDKMNRIDSRTERFVSKPEQELRKLVDELAKKDYNPIRQDLFSESELYELLADAITDGIKILMFLGSGFNRAGFLAETADGRRLVVKIPITSNGFSDNRTEVYVFAEATTKGIGDTLARTELGDSKSYVFQEACKPIKFQNIDYGRRCQLEQSAEELHFGDIQAGVSLEDGLTKIYDFAGWIR